MTALRLLAVTALLSVGACATPGKAMVPAMTPRYELCSDPSFQCGPSAPSEDAIRIDTNFATARRAPSIG